MDFGGIMKQAQAMQERIKEKMEALEVEGSAGGGMVTVRMNGSKKLLGVKVSPEIFASADREMLEDLFLAAVNVASQNVDEALKEHLGSLTGGLKIPGLF